MGSKKNKIRQIIKKGQITDPKYLASCYGKIKYQSYEAASVSANNKPHYVKPYKCSYGDHYHIGRKSTLR